MSMQSLVVVGIGESEDVFSNPSPEHVVEFQLKVKCSHNPKAPKNSQDPDELYIHSKGKCIYIVLP